MRGIGEGFEVLKPAAIPANSLPNLGICVRFVLLLQAGDDRDEDPDFLSGVGCLRLNSSGQCVCRQGKAAGIFLFFDVAVDCCGVGGSWVISDCGGVFLRLSTARGLVLCMGVYLRK